MNNEVFICLRMQPLQKVVGLSGDETDNAPVFQADNKGVDGKGVGGQLRRIVFETRKAGGESIHTSMV